MTLRKCTCGDVLTTKNVTNVKRDNGMGVDALWVTHNKMGCFSTFVLLKFADQVAQLMKHPKGKAS